MKFIIEFGYFVFPVKRFFHKSWSGWNLHFYRFYISFHKYGKFKEIEEGEPM